MTRFYFSNNKLSKLFRGVFTLNCSLIFTGTYGQKYGFKKYMYIVMNNTLKYKYCVSFDRKKQLHVGPIPHPTLYTHPPFTRLPNP